MSLAPQDTRVSDIAPGGHVLLGTAGHIDHGKTTLIRALTGVDTDRLPEEKERGMTIELGFAHLEADSGSKPVRFGIIDVPGHEKFVRTMVAGATSIDMVLLVVAADDSVMPQTREHVDIINLLGVTSGVVAVTKSDLVDSEMVDLVCDEVRELLAGSALENCPVVSVSSSSGAGLADLKTALIDQARALPERRRPGVFRLAIDRVFTIHGRGTVVTGSAISGEVCIGDALELLPAVRACKVRGLESHFDQAGSLHLGQRVAINLTGVEKHQVQRGNELATAGYLTPTRVLDAELSAVSSNAKAMKHLQRVRLCMGTAECMARIKLLGERQLRPGSRGFVQLLPREPVVAQWGQRFIVRDETDSRTLGGGVILRPVSWRMGRADAVHVDGLRVLLEGRPADRLEEVIRFEHTKPGGASSGALADLTLVCRSGADMPAIPALTQELVEQRRLIAIGDSGQLVAARMIEDAARQASEKLRRYHEQHSEEPGYPVDSFVGWLKRKWGEEVGNYLFDELKKSEVRLLGRYCCLAEFAPKMSKEDERLMRLIVAEFKQAAFQPPAVTSLKCASSVSNSRLNKLIKIACAGGELIQVAPGILLHAGKLDELKVQMAGAIKESGGLAVSDVRNLMDSSRKFVVPTLEYLDKTGFTKRVGDLRVLADGGN